jgi:hypothetical protein
VNNPDDSDSESEPEDEDDEDSNGKKRPNYSLPYDWSVLSLGTAEDYYKNDYPDEESDNSGEDEFHEDSDYEDFLRDEMEDEDHDWR